MKIVPKKGSRGDGSGIVWPRTGTASPAVVKDVFGPRPFSPHVATVGFDYDFHRGVDIAAQVGDPVKSSINGSVIRVNWSHFGWEHSSQLSRFKSTGAGTATFTKQDADTLRVTGDRVGTQSYPIDVTQFVSTDASIISNTDDWTVEIGFTTVPAIAGKVGFGIIDDNNNEYLSVEYDGTDLTVYGKDSGGSISIDGDTTTAAGKTWLRMQYTAASGVVNWKHSTDGDSWVDFTTESGISFTDNIRASLYPHLYWRSTDTNATSDTVDISSFSWVDGSTIGRFGNWVEIADDSQRYVYVHLRELTTALGNTISAGEEIGKAGLTGFDSKSGRILNPHVHFEVIPDNSYFYGNTLPVNVLASGRVPHISTDSNVAVVRTTADDPDGVSSWKLNVTVTRNDQDFDVNEFTLAGNLASRTINFNTRAGLNSDPDIPKQSGVYLVPEDFDELSTSYVLAIYFNKSVVGTVFSTAVIKDSSGTILWSETVGT